MRTVDFDGSVRKGNRLHTIELKGHSAEETYRKVALWLLGIGYKPPRFFGLIKARELSVFPKEVLDQMRKLHDRRRHH